MQQADLDFMSTIDTNHTSSTGLVTPLAVIFLYRTYLSFYFKFSLDLLIGSNVVFESRLHNDLVKWYYVVSFHWWFGIAQELAIPNHCDNGICDWLMVCQILKAHSPSNYTQRTSVEHIFVTVQRLSLSQVKCFCNCCFPYVQVNMASTHMHSFFSSQSCSATNQGSRNRGCRGLLPAPPPPPPIFCFGGGHCPHSQYYGHEMYCTCGHSALQILSMVPHVTSMVLYYDIPGICSTFNSLKMYTWPLKELRALFISELHFCLLNLFNWKTNE